ncbi:MAG: glycosyltransferase family 39 protein [Nitrospiraceae bacterium]|nr:glycosyltransferase family 39 protein [Nitrospiraceae bacterium]
MARREYMKLTYGILPVLLFGFTTGYFLWFIFSEYPAHRYALDFKGAAWISTGSPAPHGYFAKEINIPGEAADAWISVAATDNVALFVNEERISSDKFVSLNVSGIHDITGKLHTGKNVIAAYVRRTSYPGGPRLLLKGVYADLMGKEHPFLSDGTWSIATVEERQGQGSTPWFSRQFDRSRWNKAVVEGNARAFPVLASPAPPFAIGKAIAGYWIWHPKQTTRSAFFTKSVMLDSPVKDGIIGIAGGASYVLTVNGVPAAMSQSPEKTFTMYNITPLLHPGTNTIGIGVYAPESPAGLLAEGLIQSGNSTLSLTSDATWKTISDVTGQMALPGSGSPDWKTPVLVAKYPAQPWGVLYKSTGNIRIPLPFALLDFLKFCSFVAGVMAVFLCLQFMIASVHSRVAGGDFLESFAAAGVLHMPPFLFLLFVYLLQFDVRYGPSFPFQLKHVFFALMILLILQAAGFVRTRPEKSGAGNLVSSGGQTIRVLRFLLLAGIITAGFFIRIRGLDYASLSHDEVSMLQYAQGLMKSGYPHKLIGSMTKPMTTYELLPFSISVPVLLLGLSDFTARLHSVFWGTLGIYLVYLLGRTLFNRKTGLAAAAIYAFHPWCIIWSRNLFYPQLIQAWTTITVLFFYKAVNETRLNTKYLYLTGISFSLMYLSWEGSAFILFAFLLALLAHKGRDFSWARNKHLWGGFAIIFLTVFIQMSRRMFYQESYLVIAGKISDVGMPALFFLDPMYNPYFYLRMFFFAENNWILTAFLIAGMPFVFTSRPLRYLYIVLAGTVFMMTNFLQIAASRYIYHLEPLLIVCATAAAFLFVDRLRTIIDKRRTAAALSASLSLAALWSVLFLASNNVLLKLYLLSASPPDPPILTRQNVYWVDYKSTAKYVMENLRKGDVVYAMTPHTLYYYGGVHSDYSLITRLQKTSVYDVDDHYPGVFDKYMGNPVTTSLDEFQNVAAKSGRIWLVAAPVQSLMSNDKDTVNYITHNFRVVYESYNARVYLWEK